MVRSEYMLDAATLGKGETIQCGPQKLVFLAPYYGYLVLRDPMVVDDAWRLIEQINRLIEKHGGIYVLVNMSAVKEFSREVRQLADKAPSGYEAVAIVGASFPIRIATGMILRAARLLKPEALPFPVDFFTSEAEGKAWLEKLEREKAAK